MSAVQHRGAPRFRLRFLLQEFALPLGDTFIGRSHDCQITIFDPLVSRRHARIRVFGDRAVLEDLGSRNGCRVNGTLIRARIRCRPRIAFASASTSSSSGRSPPPVRFRAKGKPDRSFFARAATTSTRVKWECARAADRAKLSTMKPRSGVFTEQGKEAWAVDLLLELFNKAMSSNRADEADRAMRLVMSGLETQLRSGSRLSGDRLTPFASAAVRLAEALKDGFWVHWASDVYVRVGATVPAAVTAAIAHWDGQPKSGDRRP